MDRPGRGMSPGRRVAAVVLVSLLVAPAAVGLAGGQEASSDLSAAHGAELRTLLDRYCVSCHNDRLSTAGLSLDATVVDPSNPAGDPALWERVVAKIRAGSMPPPARPRPDAATYDLVAERLETSLDTAWLASPDPGRESPVHRLNRTEYANACLLYTSPSPRDGLLSRMPSSA